MLRKLVMGGLVLSMDDDTGRLPVGDVLVDDGRFASIGPAIKAEVVDAVGCIVLPGLVNVHLHTWQTALRGRGGDWSSAATSG